MEQKGSIRHVKEQKMLKRKKARRRRRTVFLLLEIGVFFLFAGIFVARQKLDKLQIYSFADNDIKVNEGAGKDGYTTLALFGGDSRDGVLEAGTHSDSIIVAAIHNQTKEVRMVSVYRDTLTEQMSGELLKANNAYFVGGPKEAINMLNKNFDLDIQGYATVDFTALADAIDLLDGIDLTISADEATEMNRYIAETAKVAGKEGKQVAEGTLTADGVQAVTYARIRKNVGGDYKRTDRQREVIAKVVEKAKHTNVKVLNDIIDQVFPKVSTSLTVSELISLASGISKYKIKGSKGFPFESQDGRVDNAGSVVIPVDFKANVQKLHQFLYTEEEYKVSDTVRSIAERIDATAE